MYTAYIATGESDDMQDPRTAQTLDEMADRLLAVLKAETPERVALFRAQLAAAQTDQSRGE